MITKSTIITVICWLILSSSSVSAMILEVNPSKDAWLPSEGQQSGENFGSSGYLMMASTNQGMAVIQFDISAIPTDAIIDGAALVFSIEQQLTNYYYQVYRNKAEWDEMSITFDAKPTIENYDSWRYYQAFGYGIQVGMTKYVRNWKAGTYVNNGMTIVSNRAQPLYGPPDSELAPTIYSREYANSSLRPLLHIDYHMSEVPEPSSLAALIGGLGCLGFFIRRRRS